MRIKSKTVLYPCPPKVLTAYEYSYYGKPTGLDMVRLRYLDIANDIFDAPQLSFSRDNGRTWGDTRVLGEPFKTAKGHLQSFEGLGFIDPVNGLLVNLCLEGFFTGLELLEGLTQYYLKYRVSNDGGRTSMVDERVIQRDPPGTPGMPGTYTPEHPIQGVQIGRNGILMPANQAMARTKAGHLCVCISTSLPGEKPGEFGNPGGGFTWLQEQILFGHWRPDGSGKIDWDAGPTIAIAPEKSTRGLDEPTMAIMPDGRLLLVIRTSNGGTKDSYFKIPLHKWYTISSDHGHTWSELKPWTYHDGGAFYSPGSMSTIFRHSNGKYYWLGNITPSNPQANHPRFPLVMGEIDPQTCLLRRDRLFVVETWQPGDPELLQFSGFATHEDRENGDLVIELPHFYPLDDSWTGTTYAYRVEV